MTATSSIRLPRSLVEDARNNAAVFKRTISGQLEYWARLGQAIEAAPGFDMIRIHAALDGRFTAALLSPEEMEIYEDLLGEALAAPDANEQAFFAKMTKQGGAVGCDDAGRYVRTLPGGTIDVIEEAQNGKG